MRTLLAAVALMGIAGCADPGPAGPTLPMKLRFELADYEDKGPNAPVLGIQGRLELLIEPDGKAFAATRRQIFTDFERTGPLTREQLVELTHRVDAWMLKDENPPPVPRPTGLIVYGERKVGWEKGKPLPPELQALVQFLLTIPPTLPPVWRGTKRSS